MQQRTVLSLLLAVCFSLTFAFAQDKSACPMKSGDSKAACCAHGAKTAMSSAQQPAGAPAVKASYAAGEEGNAAHCSKDAKECSKDSKECLAKGTAHHDKCTDADMAKCPAMKSSMTKSGGKACCQAKGAEAKADLKKGNRDKSADSKGTN